MTLKNTCGHNMASWNSDQEIDAMSALDLRTKLLITVLVVLVALSLLSEYASAQQPVELPTPRPFPVCEAFPCVYLPVVTR